MLHYYLAVDVFEADLLLADKGRQTETRRPTGFVNIVRLIDDYQKLFKGGGVSVSMSSCLLILDRLAHRTDHVMSKRLQKSNDCVLFKTLSDIKNELGIRINKNL